jgi:hypothetical protein
MLLPVLFTLSRFRSKNRSGVPFAGFATGVGQPENPLPLVWRSFAASRQIRRCDGIVELFQVKRYSIEPFKSVVWRNLLAKERCRAALRDEAVELGPQVPLVHFALSLAGARKRLAWAASSPNPNIVWPPCELEGIGPSADPGEEVALLVSLKLMAAHLPYVPLVNVALWYQVRFD